MAQALAHGGLALGISSGANFIGALKVQNELGPDAVVVTVFCDSNKKYLSTDLLRSEPVRDGYLSPDVEILGFRALGRVCSACVDADTAAGANTSTTPARHQHDSSLTHLFALYNVTGQ